MNKHKTEPEERKVGPKFTRSVLPADFQIRRSPTPMADLLREAEIGRPGAESAQTPGVEQPRTKQPRVESTPVKTAGVRSQQKDQVPTGRALPRAEVFFDQILTRFSPPHQVILLRLYRWSEGREKSIVVSTPRLAAKTNMNERSCRRHLKELVASGFLVRMKDGKYDARFGGDDRQARGLLLHLSAKALAELAD